MTWDEIRKDHPKQWVLMEALRAHTEGDRRIFDQLSVLDVCNANSDVFPRYSQLKKQFPQKEIIFIHGSREDPDVRLLNWHGVRISS